MTLTRSLSLTLLLAATPLAAGTTTNTFVTDLTEAGLAAETGVQLANGRALTDIEPYWNGSQVRFAAVFQTISGTVHTLLHKTPTEWQNWLTTMNALQGRYLDFEVGYFGGQKRYSGIFLEDGDDVAMPIQTTNSDSAFQALLTQNQRLGYSIIDFESYVEPGGAVRYAGMWIRDLDTPPTHLVYGLTFAERSQWLSPAKGRPVDLERYWSPLHGGYRYAVITAQIGGDNHAAVWDSSMSAAELATLHDSTADADTFLIDLDVREDSNPVRYAAVWGKDRAARAAVAPYVSVTNVEPLPATITGQIGVIENNARLGFEARNLRTNQTFEYRPEEPFYLASTVKTAIHVRLWQLFQSGHLSAATTVAYTNSAGTRGDWFVDQRNNDGSNTCSIPSAAYCATGGGSPGFNECHFGQAFPLSRFDQAMMQVSDNAATTMLLEQPTIGLLQDSLDINEWISGISGVGKGVGAIASIHDVDRMILWQGQVMDHPMATSYFPIDAWVFEPWFRCGADYYLDLHTLLGLTPGDDLPESDRDEGYRRTYNTGFNSATPRAWTRFLERFHDGEFLTTLNTASAIGVMTEGSRLASHTSFPSHVQVRTKGGSKGLESSNLETDTEAGFFRLGPDTIAVSVFANESSWASSPIQNLFGNLGLEILKGLSARLVECGAGSAGFSPTTTNPGAPFGVWCAVTNAGGGDAAAFDVTFRLSTDPTITGADTSIGTVRSSGLAGNGASFLANLQTTLPANLAPGTYYVGWEIDRELSGVWGEVGEHDESADAHLGVVPGMMLTVLPVGTIFSDGFESGTTAAWSAVVP